MANLNIRLFSSEEISPELELQSSELDRLAFSDENPNDPVLSGIEWSSHDWMALGFLKKELVTQLCLIKRGILVGEQPVWVAGVGGVATHSHWQRRGFASQLLRESKTFMYDKMCVPFGLLICAEETQTVYAHCGWQTVAKSVDFIQNGEHRTLDTCVMILPLTTQAWLPGVINLCGLPW
jgi:GNAT superfamily N-acetyltransferase